MQLLIALDLAWSLIALVHDAPAILAIPIWALPFIVICPLYPLLLAIAWWQPRLTLLRTFASLASLYYGLLVIAFYPLVMQYQGFAWDTLLGIPWVLFYGVQGAYLFLHSAHQKKAVYATSLFLCVSLAVQYFSLTFGYLGADILPRLAQQFLLILGLVLIGALAIAAPNRAASPGTPS